MPKYSIQVFCDDCGDFHPMRSNFPMARSAEQRLETFIKGETSPPQVATLINNKTICPKTGRWILQRNNLRVFLVASIQRDSQFGIGGRAIVNSLRTAIRKRGDILLRWPSRIIRDCSRKRYCSS
jgi:hypothetical protein